MANGAINLRMLGSDRSAGTYDVVARIEALDHKAAGNDGSIDLIVAAQSTAGTDVSLQPGLYNVQVFLPNGRILQQACEVETGATVPMTFLTPSGDAAGFSLQAALGTASPLDLLTSAIGARTTSTTKAPRATATRTPPKASRKPQGATPKPERSRSGAARMTRGGNAVGSSRTKANPTVLPRAVSRQPRAFANSGPPAAIGVPEMCLTGPGAFEGQLSWTRLAAGPRSWNGEKEAWTQPRPINSRDQASIWRLAPDVAGKVPGNGRVWALVRTKSSTEAVSLPAPWRCAQSLRLSPIDLLVDATLGGRAASSVAVNDAGLDGLLSYLDSGRLTSLRPMVSQLERSGIIERTIDEKASNPLGACAAAYVGLAIFDPYEQERWDSWLPNIMNRFPWLPDGGIVHARRIMLRPKNSDESVEALSALKRSYNAGVPYYSAGLQLMRDMLGLFAGEHPEAAKMLAAVAPVAARSDPKQMFTVLRFPEAKS